MKWLKEVRAPKFYRYFFYKQYVLSKGWGNIQPAFSTMLMTAVTLMFHATFLSIIIGEVFEIRILDFLFLDRGPFEIIGYFIFFLLVAYVFFYYKEKWSKIIKEFESENEKQRILGKYYLYIYLFVSIFCLFLGLLWYIETTNTIKRQEMYREERTIKRDNTGVDVLSIL